MADELGMKYMPKIDLVGYYKNDHGYDYRALNPLLPERLRLCDWEMFHECPSRHSICLMQIYLLKLRVWQYVQALQHVFNTGQGVVMSRSAFGERVFVEAMHNLGWLPMGYVRGDGARFYDYKNFYNYLRNLALLTLFKPHLTIYLETPVDVCMSRIKESPDPMIANSQALVPEFLEKIQEAYEDVMIQKFDNCGHVFRVPYAEKATRDEIRDHIDDLRELEFEYDEHDSRFENWHQKTRLWYFYQRRFWTTNHCMAPINAMRAPHWDIAGLGDSISNVDLILRDRLFEAHTKDVGDIKWNMDLRFQKNLVKAILDYDNFGRRLEKKVRMDFV